MYPKIKHIRVDKDYILVVSFDNGIRKKYDFKKNLTNPVFAPLKDIHLFRQVNVDPGGME